MINIDIEESASIQPSNFVGNWPYIVNLSNSIIGVPLLALPFCFKECGIILGSFLLLGSSQLAKFSCKILIKSAIFTRRRSYEFLAFSALGYPGKILVELSIIGLLVGTCMAFYIIIGDIGPSFISQISNVQNTPTLRIIVIFVIGSCVILPLCLQPNFDSISNLSALSLTFYIIFLAYMIITSFANIWTLNWFGDIVWFNWNGTFKCLPIFALSYACQSQLFIMYDSLVNVPTKRVDNIINGSISLCTAIYSMVGFFGYLAFSKVEIKADILMNIEPTLISEIIKLGFMISTILSFPLIVFPCRSSVYILLFTKNGNVTRTNSGSVLIPSIHHQNITIFLVIFTMIFAAIQPNVEFVLGLTGATLGSLLIFIFPSVIFTTLPLKDSWMVKFWVKILFVIGAIVLVLSTYATLTSEGHHVTSNAKPTTILPIIKPYIPVIFNESYVQKIDNYQKDNNLARNHIFKKSAIYIPINDINENIATTILNATLTKLLTVN